MKRGQAAIEFLTTYGLSMMIVLVAFGALFYFGIFNISNFVPSSCNLGNNIFCPVYSLEADATRFAVNVQLANNGDGRVILTNMSIKDASLDVYCFAKQITDTAGVPLTPAELTIASRQDKDLVFEFEHGFSSCDYNNSFIGSDNKRKYDVRLYYIADGATIETSVSGGITAPTSVWS